jgi:hypothetical protein
VEPGRFRTGVLGHGRSACTGIAGALLSLGQVQVEEIRADAGYPLLIRWPARLPSSRAPASCWVEAARANQPSVEGVECGPVRVPVAPRGAFGTPGGIQRCRLSIERSTQLPPIYGSIPVTAFNGVDAKGLGGPTNPASGVRCLGPGAGGGIDAS